MLNRLLRNLYASHSTGCCLHVQLDDGNCEDRFFDADDEARVRACGAAEHMQIFLILRDMSESERIDMHLTMEG